MVSKCSRSRVGRRSAMDQFDKSGHPMGSRQPTQWMMATGELGSFFLRCLCNAHLNICIPPQQHLPRQTPYSSRSFLQYHLPLSGVITLPARDHTACPMRCHSQHNRWNGMRVLVIKNNQPATIAAEMQQDLLKVSLSLLLCHQICHHHHHHRCCVIIYVV